MKSLVFAAALMVGGAAAAQTYDPVPPGDGITRQGTNPEGQAYTPPGFNQGLAVYPPAQAAPGGQPGMENYPACTQEVKDRCIQTYTRWTNR